MQLLVSHMVSLRKDCSNLLYLILDDVTPIGNAAAALGSAAVARLREPSFSRSSGAVAGRTVYQVERI